MDDEKRVGTLKLSARLRRICSLITLIRRNIKRAVMKVNETVFFFYFYFFQNVPCSAGTLSQPDVLSVIGSGRTSL